MKGLNRKIVSKVLLLVLICQFFAVNVFAAVDGSNVSYVCDYVDSAIDGTVLTNANAAANGLKAKDLEGKTAFEALLTDGFNQKFGGNVSEAKAALANMIAKTVAVYFSKTSAEFEANLNAAEASVSPYFTAAFGDTADIQHWFDLFLKAKLNMQYLEARNLTKWALGTRAELLPVMDGVHIRAVEAMFESVDYADVKSGFESFGWTVGAFVDAVREIVNMADGNDMAEYALLKAAARSAISLEINGSEDVALRDAGKGVVIEDTVKQYTTSNVPTDTQTARIIITLDKGYNVSNVVNITSTNPDVATVVNNEALENITITYTGNAGTADIIVTRQPFTDSTNPLQTDWILRYRVVVTDVIDTVSKPVWGTGSEEGILSWDAVTGATGYKVSLYKDGAIIKIIDSITDVKYDLNDYITSVGSYTATVSAYSSNAEGDASEFSAPYVVTGPEAPTNVEWTDAVLTWDASAGAESYIVKIYDKATSSVIKTYTVSDCTVNATDFLNSKYGVFYATVEAVDTHNIKSSAVKSSDYITYSVIKGNVKLESFFGTKQNSKGIKVSFGNVTAETDENGDFILEGILPNTTATLKFEHRWYLTFSESFTCSSKEVVLNNNETIVLLYGDSDGIYGIGALDLSDIISRLDKTVGDPAYDADADCHHDANESTAIIQLEELNTAIRNAGKLTEVDYKGIIK